MRSAARLTAALCAGAALLGSGCESCAQKSASSPSRAGIHVPLPDGWSATVQADHGLKAGPKGRAVLRVDVRTGAGAGQALPAPLSLAEEFTREGTGMRVTAVSEVADKDLSLVLLEVSTQGSRARAMLGVKRLGRDLLLCSSEPGSSEDEVRLAAEACRGLSEAGGDS